MTNEEKERVRIDVETVCDFYINKLGKTPWLIGQYTEAKKRLLSLLDRVPSEEEANDTWDRLKNITLKNGCDYPEYCDADNCSDFVERFVILEKIRKALNIEGKE